MANTLYLIRVITLIGGTSFTTNANTVLMTVEVVGGGARGNSWGGGLGVSSGGGGGGGGCAIKTFATTGDTSYSYTIGNGGDDEYIATQTSSTFTVDGIVVTGNAGQNGGDHVYWGCSGGLGGVASNGDINLTGEDGEPGKWLNGLSYTAAATLSGGNGGASRCGGGGAGANFDDAFGTAGSLYGGGGGGGSYSAEPGGDNSAYGGNGGDGCIVIWEYGEFSG